MSFCRSLPVGVFLDSAPGRAGRGAREHRPFPPSQVLREARYVLYAVIVSVDRSGPFEIRL